MNESTDRSGSDGLSAAPARRPRALNVVDLVSGTPIGTDHTTLAGAVEQATRRKVRPSSPSSPIDVRPEVLFVDDLSQWSPRNERLRDALVSAGPGFQIVMGLSQRELFSSPGAALELRDRVRVRGWGLSVNGVGADPASLAMLPLIEPEVISLDASVIRRTRRDAEATAALAVGWARRWGALVVAEGVRNAADRDFALAVGAQVGHGSFWSKTLRSSRSPVSDVLSPWITLLSDWAIGTGGPTSASQLLDRHQATSVGDLATVLAHSHRIERQAADGAGPSSVLLAAFQHRRRLGRESKSRFLELASTITFVGVLGVDMPSEPLPGVRGASVEAGEIAALEWNVVTISAAYEAALISREIAPDGGTRLFQYLVTDDGAAVRQTARVMLRRFRDPCPPIEN